MCKFFNLYEESLHLGVCKLAKYVRTALFSGKIYTSDKNFTRPPVATVATNSKSADANLIFFEIEFVLALLAPSGGNLNFQLMPD